MADVTLRRTRIRLLNTDLLVRQRLAHGLSQRRLAMLIGVSAPVVTRWEDGIGHGEIPLWRLHTLADTLGLPIGALLREEDREEPTASDAVKAEAALAMSSTYLRTDELAAGLRWPLPRVRAALQQVRAHLNTTGLLLHRTTNGWTILARAGVLTADQEHGLAAARRQRRGLRLDEARLLWRAYVRPLDRRWEQQASQADRRLLGRLLRDGILRYEDSRYLVSADVQAAIRLGLAATEEP